jgi:hypothetical protein
LDEKLLALEVEQRLAEAEARNGEAATSNQERLRQQIREQLEKERLDQGREGRHRRPSLSTPSTRRSSPGIARNGPTDTFKPDWPPCWCWPVSDAQSSAGARGPRRPGAVMR